jgi:hypothetical protein
MKLCEQARSPFRQAQGPEWVEGEIGLQRSRNFWIWMQHITLQVGSPLAPIPMYNFQG